MTELFSNIRHLYRFEPPCDQLKNYIEFFSESSVEATKQIANGRPFSIKMFKSWTPTFWINLGPSYKLMLNERVQVIKANSAIATTRAVTAERVNQPSDYLFTVKFYPGALNHIIGVDQTKLRSGLVELSELLPQAFIQQIKSAKSFERRIDLIQHYLLQKMTAKKYDHYTDLVTKTIAVYLDGEMKFNVSQLSFKSFTSSKTLTRYFERVVGITPKQYFESVRVRTALPAFLNDRKVFDATAYGYYDTSHFYKSVVRFTGERLSDPS